MVNEWLVNKTPTGEGVDFGPAAVIAVGDVLAFHPDMLTDFGAVGEWVSIRAAWFDCIFLSWHPDANRFDDQSAKFVGVCGS